MAAPPSIPADDTTIKSGELSAVDNVARTTEFWLRASSIYFGYKITQLKAFAATAARWPADKIKTDVWDVQQQRAAEQMYSLCVDLRGFYLKAGQFLGARGDFVPEQICRKLSLLHDQVPPMPADQVRTVVETELGGIPLDQVFEWIDLDSPLGSASISQVHKAKLRPLPAKLHRRRRSLWLFGCGGGGGRGWFPLDFFLPFLASSSSPTLKTTSAVSSRNPELLDPFSTAPPPPVDLALAWQQAPKDGIVAVKVQYPNALPTMSLDLSNLRLLAAFLSKTEIKFDMLSTVDELARQIRLEFDFRREARIMDAVARQFDGLRGGRIQVPRSVPSMVTPRLLVMNFLDGVPITRMKDHIGFKNLSEATKKMAAKRILTTVSEAYGRMVLLDGLFQADGHPGNILVMKRGRIGLIDYGQSKRLPDEYRRSFAALVVALADGDERRVSEALDGLGVVTERSSSSSSSNRGTNSSAESIAQRKQQEEQKLKADVARGMFDTSGKADPFDPESPIKKIGIKTFPRDIFFVLRVVQLLRGLADGMGVKDFSSAKQWKPFAEDTLRQLPASVSLGLVPFIYISSLQQQED